MIRNLIKVAAALSGNRLARHGREAAGKIAILAGAAFIASVSAMAAIGCALWALWIFALPIAGPVGAPLIVAAALFTICLASIAAAKRSLRPRRRHMRAQPLSSASLSHEASELVRDQKTALLLSALLAGVVAGSSRK